MATIHAFMYVHERDCPGDVYHGECSAGCEFRQFEAIARFEPQPDEDLRATILRARMAAMFEARRMVRAGEVA